MREIVRDLRNIGHEIKATKHLQRLRKNKNLGSHARARERTLFKARKFSQGAMTEAQKIKLDNYLNKTFGANYTPSSIQKTMRGFHQNVVRDILNIKIGGSSKVPMPKVSMEVVYYESGGKYRPYVFGKRDAPVEALKNGYPLPTQQITFGAYIQKMVEFVKNLPTIVTIDGVYIPSQDIGRAQTVCMEKINNAYFAFFARQKKRYFGDTKKSAVLIKARNKKRKNQGTTLASKYKKANAIKSAQQKAVRVLNKTRAQKIYNKSRARKHGSMVNAWRPTAARVRPTSFHLENKDGELLKLSDGYKQGYASVAHFTPKEFQQIHKIIKKKRPQRKTRYDGSTKI